MGIALGDLCLLLGSQRQRNKPGMMGRNHLRAILVCDRLWERA